MEILTLLTALWAHIAPFLAVLEPLAKLAGPIASQLSPLVDIVSGPLSFVAVWLLFPAYALWVFYLAVMNLKRGRDLGALTGVTYAFGLPVLIVGYVLDFFVTVTLGSIVFLDLPCETTLTARLKRYAQAPGTWRFTITVWIAHHLLDKFDPTGWHVAEVYETATDALPIDPTDKQLTAMQALMAKFTG